MPLSAMKLCLVRVLPRKVNVRAAEVTVGGRLPVDGEAKIQHSNDAVWAQVKVLLDQTAQLVLRPACSCRRCLPAH